MVTIQMGGYWFENSWQRLYSRHVKFSVEVQSLCLTGQLTE